MCDPLPPNPAACIRRCREQAQTREGGREGGGEEGKEGKLRLPWQAWQDAELPTAAVNLEPGAVEWLLLLSGPPADKREEAGRGGEGREGGGLAGRRSHPFLRKEDLEALVRVHGMEEEGVVVVGEGGKEGGSTPAAWTEVMAPVVHAWYDARF
jgi:hypothetical protein